MSASAVTERQARIWTAGFCGVFLLLCGLVWFSVSNDGGLNEVELRSKGYVDCSNWQGALGIDEDAECIDHGELVKYWDTSYGASSRRARDYAESID